VDLDFSAEQQALRGMVREVCRDYSTIEVVRAMEDDPRGFPEELWKQLAEVGLLAIRIGEAHGGAQQGLLETAIVYEELGRALAPVPHFVSCIVSAGVLERGGDEAQKRWLAGIADGSALLTPAWLEPERGYGPAGVALRATADGDGFRLDGTKRHVAFASAADRLIVVARSADGEAGIDLFLVDPAAEGVRLTQQLSLASDTRYRVDLEGVRVGAADRIGDAGTGWATLCDVLYEGAVLNAAWANGACEQALEITAAYAKERVQFGKPLAAFQALAHYLADARTQLDGSRTLAHQAAWAHDAGRPIDELAPMAKLFACQTFRDATARCEQIWGGIGFTVECDIQLFFRRAKQLQLSWWDTRHLEELIARCTLD
jgi:alkylation response protein AidB-like acyl-CoA dehydrogenase